MNFCAKAKQTVQMTSEKKIIEIQVNAHMKQLGILMDSLFFVYVIRIDWVDACVSWWNN